MIEMDKDGGIYVVTMNNGQNMICPTWQERMLECLDIMEKETAAGTAMVLTGMEKFFCNGLNLEVLMQLDKASQAEFGPKMAEIHRRLLLLPIPTVAAVNGHAFAGGAISEGLVSDGHDIVVSERSRANSSELSARFDNVTVADNQGVLDASDVVFVGSTAEQAEAMLSALRFREGQRVISFNTSRPMAAVRSWSRWRVSTSSAALPSISATRP